jgi:hypothetical protein
MFNNTTSNVSGAFNYNSWVNNCSCADLFRVEPRNIFDKYFYIADGALASKSLANHSFCPAGILGSSLKLEESAHCTSSIIHVIKGLSRCSASSLYAQRRSQCTCLPKGNSVEANLQLGKEILSDTLNTMLFSSNNLARSRIIFEDQARNQHVALQDLTDVSQDVAHCLKVVRAAVMFNMEGGLFERTETAVKIAENVHFGNCWEMALVGLFKGMERGIWDTRLEVAKIENGDHAIIILGRQPGSDPNDYKTWGSSTVVIDSWAGKIFKLSEVETKLNDYISVDDVTGVPVLRPFDPQTQQLQIMYGNTCFKEDLLVEKNKLLLSDEQSSAYDAVVQQLDRFHQTQVLHEKLPAANDLFALCNDPKIGFLSSIETLKDQTNHFIELANKWTARK